jgi:hypothetical protein
LRSPYDALDFLVSQYHPELRPENDVVRKKTILALMIAATATPAFAQVGTGVGPNLTGETRKLKTDVEIKQEEEREAGYKSGLSKIPDAKATKTDPWGGVRGTSSSSPGAGQSRAHSK